MLKSLQSVIIALISNESGVRSYQNADVPFERTKIRLTHFFVEYPIQSETILECRGNRFVRFSFAESFNISTNSYAVINPLIIETLLEKKTRHKDIGTVIYGWPCFCKLENYKIT